MRRWAAGLSAVVLAAGVLVPSGAAGAQSSGSAVGVVLGSSLADVGAAAGLLAAGRVDSVVMASSSDALGVDALQRLWSSGASRVVIVGGTAAVSAAAKAELRGVLPRAAVSRVAGETRAHTAALVARQVLGSRSANVRIAVANGWSQADVAVAAAAVASGAVDAAVWTESDEVLGAAASAVLARYAPVQVMLVGGTAALSDDVADAAADAAGATAGVLRLGGKNRARTALLVARAAYQASAASANTVVVADGWDAAAASAAALAAAARDAAVLYGNPDGSLDEASAAFLRAAKSTEVIVIGSAQRAASLDAAVSAAVRAAEVTRYSPASVHMARTTARNTTSGGGSFGGGGGGGGSGSGGGGSFGGSFGGGGGSGSGGGGGSGVVTATPIDVPAAPTNAVASAASASRVDVIWDLAEVTAARPRTAVVLEWHPTSDSTDVTTVVLGAAVTSHTVSGLDASTAYTFEVSARNAAGDSAPDTATATTLAGAAPADPNACSAPSSVSPVVSSSRGLLVSWTYDASGVCAVSGFTVQRRYGGNAWIPTTVSASLRQQRLGGLIAGSRYEVPVTANLTATHNGSAVTKTSSIARATPIDDPAAPTAATATAASDSSVDVSWTLPAATTARPRTAVILKWHPTSNANATTTVPLGAGVTSHTVTGLTAETGYTFEVKTRNEAGDSAAVSDTATTPAEPLAVWMARLPEFSGLDTAVGGTPLPGIQYETGANKTGVSATCTLKRSGHSEQDNLQCNPGDVNRDGIFDALNFVTVTGSGGVSNPFKLATVDWGREMEIYATATLDSETATSEVYYVEVGGPIAPQVAVSAGNTKIKVGWSAPASPAGQQRPGATLAGYRVWWRAQNTDGTWPDTWQKSSWLDAHVREHTIESLTNGTGYQIRVRARNDAADSDNTTFHDGMTSGSCASDASVMCNATPSGATIRVPEPPRFGSTRVSRATNGDATVTWRAPSNTGGTTIHAYDIRWQASGDGTVWSSETVSGRATSHTIGGLLPGTNYNIEIRASNAAGDSSWAIASNFEPPKVWFISGTPFVIYQPVLGRQSANVIYRPSTDKLASMSCDLRADTTTEELESRFHCPRNVFTTHAGLGDSSAKLTVESAELANSDFSIRWDHDLQIRATATAGGGGSRSTEWDFFYEVGGPTAPEIAVSAGNTKIKVGWSEPTAPAAASTSPWQRPGAVLAGYRVWYRAQSTDGTWPAWQKSAWLGADVREHVLESLSNDKQYQIRVRARNDAADDDAATFHDGMTSGTCTADESVMCAATPASGAEAPDPPTSGAVTLSTDKNQATVTWTAPADTGGTTLHKYDVRYQASGATEWTTETVHGRETSHTITGLDAATGYTYQVRASNAAGDSGWAAAGTTGTTGTPLKVWFVSGYPAPRYHLSSVTDSGVVIWAPSQTDRTADVSCDMLAGTEAVEARSTLRCPSGILGVRWEGLSHGQSGHDSYNANLVTVSVQSTNPVNRYHLVAPIWDKELQFRATATAGTVQAATEWDFFYEIGGPTAPELAVSAGNGTIKIGWSTPTVPAGTPPGTWQRPGADLAGYRVWYRAQNTDGTWPAWTKDAWLAATAREHSITATNGTSYQIRVRARNDAADDDAATFHDGMTSGSCTADASVMCNATPSTTAITAPGVPTFAASPITLSADKTKATVTWVAPVDTGGTTLHAYDIRYQASGASTWTTETVSGRATSYTVSGLDAATGYTIQVQASNAAGDSGWAAAGTTSTPLKVWFTNGAPFVILAHTTALVGGISTATLGAVVYYNLGGNRALSAECDVRADTTTEESGSRIDCFRGRWTDMRGIRDNNPNLQVSSTQLANSDFSVRWDHGLQIRADATASGNTATSEWDFFYEIGGPTAPEVAVSAGDGTIKVGWSAPTAPAIFSTATWQRDGATLAGYQVWHRAQGTDGSWPAWTKSAWLGADVREHVLENLSNDKQYQVRVRARNDAADDDAATFHDGMTSGTCTADESVMCAATPASGATAPGKPTFAANAVSLSADKTKATVTWAAPAHTGGTTIHKYDVRYQAAGASTWTTRTVHGRATSYTITGLDASTNYTIEVRAGNAAGDSVWARQTTAVTPLKVWFKFDANSIRFNYDTSHQSAKGVRYFARTEVNKAASATCDILAGTDTVEVDSTINCPPGTYVNDAGLDVQTIGVDSYNPHLVTVTKYDHHQHDPKYHLDDVRWDNELQFRANATAGSETASTEWDFFTDVGGPATPEVAVSAGDGEIEIGWTLPIRVGRPGSAYSGYQVWSRAQNTNGTWPAWTKGTWLGADVREARIAATNGTEYQIRVRARNNAADTVATTHHEGMTSGSCTGDDSVMCAATPSATTITVPGVPTFGANPVTLNSDKNAATVTWVAPADTGGTTLHAYDVRYQASGASTWTTETVSGRATSHTITGLDAATGYTFEVQASNAAGDSGWARAGTTGAPLKAWFTNGTPYLSYAAWSSGSFSGTRATLYLRLTANDVFRATDACDLRADTTANETDSRKACTRNAFVQFSGLGTTASNVVQVSNAQLANSDFSVRWDHNLQIRGNAVSSSASGTTEWDFFYEIGGPAAPQVAVSAGDGEIKVGWSVAAVPAAFSNTAQQRPGANLAGYRVWWRAQNSNGTWPATWQKSTNWLAATAREHTITATNGTKYQIRVRARNDAADDDDATFHDGMTSGSCTADESVMCAATPASGATAPGVPTFGASPIALSDDGTEATVTWVAPADTGGTTLHAYDIRYQAAGASTWTTRTVSGRTLSYKITGLGASTNYSIEVRASNAAGDSDWAAVPGGITRTVYKVWFVSDTPWVRSSATEVRVWMRAMTNVPETLLPSTGWMVCQLNHTGSDHSRVNCPGTFASIGTTSTSTGANLNCFIAVCTSGGTVFGSFDWNRAIHPEAVVTLTDGTKVSSIRYSAELGGPGSVPFAVSAANGKIAVGWSPPERLGKPGNTIKQYSIDWRVAGTTGWSSLQTALEPTVRSHTLTGLDAAKTYEIRVYADAQGDLGGTTTTFEGMRGGPCGGEVHLHCQAAPATKTVMVPGVPQSLAAVVGSNAGEIDVSWAVPASTGGAGVHLYRVRYYETADKANTREVINVGGNTTSLTLTGLTSGTSYTIEVRAENIQGHSDFATAATATPS